MADGFSSFWGPVTSTHEWCEPNYVHSSYIAEFFNTVSNVPCIILALIGLVNSLRQRFEKRFSVLHVSNMVLAIGSMLYHATLQRLQQQVFAIAHSQIRFDIGFKVHYALLCLLCIPRMYKYYIHTEDKSAKRLAKFYLVTLLAGSFFWLVDRLFCKDISSLWYFNPQGHALWHVLMGFNSYFANTCLMYWRAEQRGWNPKVKQFLGIFPYVKIQKPKTQ
ncbi:UNVERIFIED_CONTAM: Alkaline ceramidase [Sesamum angustifolium]|uniref:Alkaline ceramidase n=1 Tax=Sesamum angustifolium TaxID=2727405 RepID=A0AAW2II41_9LAMI